MTSKTQVAAWKGIVIWTKEKAVLHNPLNDKVVGKLRPLIHTWLQSALDTAMNRAHALAIRDSVQARKVLLEKRALKP